MSKLYRIILNLKAIQFACMSAAQEDTDNPIVNIDKEAQESLDWAVKELEKKLHRRNRKNIYRGRRNA